MSFAKIITQQLGPQKVVDYNAVFHLRRSVENTEKADGLRHPETEVLDSVCDHLAKRL